MPGIDWIPGVSQIKALAQAITGDTEGASRTTENFFRECPGVSQVTSVVQLAAGDAEGALETQKRCLGTVNNLANSVPVIGHAKGLIHHAFGDHQGGNQALNAATRSTVVVASGAAAAVATEGIAAIPAGIAAGAAYDATASAVTGEDQGYIAAIKNAAENPSAGAFIDAVAIPVGDGLAGYSGEQISNEIQVNDFESLREAKLEQMDAATAFGEALQLGHDGNTLTAKINTIKHGTPHYWNDPKTGTVASEASSSNVAVPVLVPQYVDENNQEEKEVTHGCGHPEDQEGESYQEDALYHDSYVESIVVTDKNRQEAQKELYERDKQKPEGKKQNGPLTTPEELSTLLESIHREPNRDPYRDPCNSVKDSNNQLIKWSWLLLIMPKEFQNTVLAQLNSCYTGPYHSFIRHVDDWAQVIPSDFNRLHHRLSPLMAAIQNLTSQIGHAASEAARSQFLEARNRLSRATYDDFQAALVEIQISMYRFIQDNVTFDNYQGRSVNMDGAERLYFKVQTATGTMVMVVCLPAERFEPWPGDPRPVRILTTVFFESWAKFKSHGLVETKEEMLKKQKEDMQKTRKYK